MQVLTLDSLALKAPEGKRLVVLGDPVAHSLSPAMHNAALAEMARTWPDFADWQYEAVHVPADHLDRALPILHAAGVAGINLTIPHKVRVLGLLEELDEGSRAMGAVNTLIWKPGGYGGTNTDGYGITKAIEEALGRSLGAADVWLFGAGGAARGIAVACLAAGAQRITLLNRTAARLQELEADFRRGNPADLGKIRFCALAAMPTDMAPEAILINATSLGLKAEDPSPVPAGLLRGGISVYDTTYGVRNRLARECAAHGIAYADGLPMLVWQGVRSLEIWTGKAVPAACMRRAAEEELARRVQNG